MTRFGQTPVTAPLHSNRCDGIYGEEIPHTRSGMAVATPDPCEVEFQQVLDIASQLRDEYEVRLAAATAKLRKKSLGRRDLPDRLYVELLTTADYQYDAALTLIANPRVAFAAEQNIRSLDDAVAQVAFVMGKDTKRPMGTEIQRAICLSLSRARELEEMYAEAAKAKKAGKVSANRATKVRTLYESMHTDIGCPWEPDRAKWPCRRLRSHPCTSAAQCRHQENWPCRPKKRPHQLVGVTLEGLERQLWPRKRKHRFLLDQHKVSSILIHQSLVARVIRDNKRGLDLRAIPTFAERYALLVRTFSQYAMFLRWLLAKHPGADVKGLSIFETAFYLLQPVRDAMTGVLKARCP